MKRHSLVQSVFKSACFSRKQNLQLQNSLIFIFKHQTNKWWYFFEHHGDNFNFVKNFLEHKSPTLNEFIHLKLPMSQIGDQIPFWLGVITPFPNQMILRGWHQCLKSYSQMWQSLIDQLLHRFAKRSFLTFSNVNFSISHNITMIKWSTSINIL